MFFLIIWGWWQASELISAHGMGVMSPGGVAREKWASHYSIKAVRGTLGVLVASLPSGLQLPLPGPSPAHQVPKTH
jgi:hypothetical protein